MKSQTLSANSIPFALFLTATAALAVGCVEDGQEQPSAVLVYGTATYPDGTPASNRPFDARITIQGIGSPVCDAGQNDPMPVSGSLDTSLAFDGGGTFQYQADSAFAEWAFDSAEERGDSCDQLPNRGSDRYVDYVDFEKINIVRIDASIAVTKEVCNEYCQSYTHDYCTSFCQSDAWAGTASCEQTCGTEQYGSCETRCHNSKRIVAVATAYGTELQGIETGEGGGSATTSSTLPSLKFELKFSSLE